MSAAREDRLALGLVLGVFAFFCFAITDVSAKMLVNLGYSAIVVAFFRYAVNLVLVVGWFLPREGRNAFVSTVPSMQILRGLLLLNSTVFNFWALKYLPLTTTVPIFFAMPLVVCLLSFPLLGEKVGIRRYTAVLIGFVGVIMIVRPGAVTFHWAMILSLTATTSASLYFIMTRAIAGRDDTPVSQIYMSGIATFALLPFVLFFWQTPDSVAHWGLLFSAGAAAGIGHSVLTISYRYGEASKLSPVIYSQIITITFFSWLLFDQVPDFWTVAGTAVIILSGGYIWWRERKLS